MARVTVVNDNPEFLDLVREILEDDRYQTTTIDGDQPDALDKIRASRPDVLMIDLRLGHDGLHGWDIAKQVRDEPALHGLPVLVCSADLWTLKEIADELAQAQDVATLTKPFAVEELVAAIDNLLAAAA